MIYLDHAATTSVCPEAVQAAVEAMTLEFGNPSSRHGLGVTASQQLEKNRTTIADALGCDSNELYFTSCGTEGNNWAIEMAVELGKRVGKHIITTAIEHSAVLQPMAELERNGYQVTYLKPNKSGHVTMEQVEQALREDTVLVSMMLVNNEVGTYMPVKETCQLIKKLGYQTLVHCDGVQGFLKTPCHAHDLGVDFLSISGHKIRGPKGIGALYIRKGIKAKPWLIGGGQEQGLRAGTSATAQVAAFAAACESWKNHEKVNTECINTCKENFLESFLGEIPCGVVLSAGDAPHICAVSLPGYPSEMVVRELSDKGIYISSGSACHKGKASHVFAAMGFNKLEQMGALRVSFGCDSKVEDGQALVQAMKEITETRMAVR